MSLDWQGGRHVLHVLNPGGGHVLEGHAETVDLAEVVSAGDFENVVGFFRNYETSSRDTIEFQSCFFVEGVDPPRNISLEMKVGSLPQRRGVCCVGESHEILCVMRDNSQRVLRRATVGRLKRDARR